MLAAARLTPGLVAGVSSRIDHWAKFAQTAIEKTLDPMLLAATMPVCEIAYLTVATYLGLELLGHLGDDRTRGLATLLGHARITGRRFDWPAAALTVRTNAF